jgi:hypothetical protein
VANEADFSGVKIGQIVVIKITGKQHAEQSRKVQNGLSIAVVHARHTGELRAVPARVEPFCRSVKTVIVQINTTPRCSDDTGRTVPQGQNQMRLRPAAMTGRVHNRNGAPSAAKRLRHNPQIMADRGVTAADKGQRPALGRHRTDREVEIER